MTNYQWIQLSSINTYSTWDEGSQSQLGVQRSLTNDAIVNGPQHSCFCIHLKGQDNWSLFFTIDYNNSEQNLAYFIAIFVGCCSPISIPSSRFHLLYYWIKCGQGKDVEITVLTPKPDWPSAWHWTWMLFPHRVHTACHTMLQHAWLPAVCSLWFIPFHSTITQGGSGSVIHCHSMLHWHISAAVCL